MDRVFYTVSPIGELALENNAFVVCIVMFLIIGDKLIGSKCSACLNEICSAAVGVQTLLSDDDALTIGQVVIALPVEIATRYYIFSVRQAECSFLLA